MMQDPLVVEQVQAAQTYSSMTAGRPGLAYSEVPVPIFQDCDSQ